MFLRQNLPIFGEESIRESYKSPLLPPSMMAKKNYSATIPDFDLNQKSFALDPIFKVTKQNFLEEDDSDNESEKKKTVKEEYSDSLETSKEFKEEEENSEGSHQRLMNEINASEKSQESVIKL